MYSTVVMCLTKNVETVSKHRIMVTLPLGKRKGIHKLANKHCIYNQNKMKRKSSSWSSNSCMKTVTGDLCHFCQHNKGYRQKTEGIKSPVEVAPFEALLAYNKGVDLLNSNDTAQLS